MKKAPIATDIDSRVTSEQTLMSLEVARIAEKYRGQRGALISILGEVQSRYNYLPEEALRIIAEKTSKPLTDIYGVATFYSSFSLKPRGRHLCSVCKGTACHVRGAEGVSAEFEKQLNVKPGDTTPDNEFTLETVNCLGACALGPIVVVDGHYFSGVSKTKVWDIINRSREGITSSTDIDKLFPVEVLCPHCNHSFMDSEVQLDGFPSIRVTCAFQRHHGWLRLSSLYGSYTTSSEYDIPDRATVNFFCPHCNAELAGAANCDECGAPMVLMVVGGGGMIQVCSRHGCLSHRLDVG